MFLKLFKLKELAFIGLIYPRQSRKVLLVRFCHIENIKWRRGTFLSTIENCIEAKKVDCGTSKKAVLDKINLSKKLLSGYEKDLKNLTEKIPVFEDILSAYI